LSRVWTSNETTKQEKFDAEIEKNKKNGKGSHSKIRGYRAGGKNALGGTVKKHFRQKASEVEGPVLIKKEYGLKKSKKREQNGEDSERGARSNKRQL